MKTSIFYRQTINEREPGFFCSEVSCLRVNEGFPPTLYSQVLQGPLRLSDKLSVSSPNKLPGKLKAVTTAPVFLNTDVLYHSPKWPSLGTHSANVYEHLLCTTC